MATLSRQEYLDLKEDIRLNDNDRGWNRCKALIERAEAECSPQQKAAIYRMLGQRENDFMEREARGVNAYGFPD